MSWRSGAGLLIGLLLLGAGLALAVPTGGGGAGSGGRPGSPPSLPTQAPTSVSASFTGMQARCEARLMTPVVHPGQTPAVRYTLVNLGPRPLRYATYFDFPSITDASGTTVYTWLEQYGGATPSLPAPALLHTLGPRRSVARSGLGQEPVIAWVGPLELRLTCPFVVGTKAHHTITTVTSPRLPALPLRVSSPGRTPSVGVAIARAVAAAQGLFATCRPHTEGRTVVGGILPPKVASPPKVIPAPMRARCWASVDAEAGFDVVTLAFVSPPSAHVGSVGSFARPIALPRLRTVEVLRWTFVVTPWATTSGLAAAAGTSATPTVGYWFTHGRWNAGGMSCQGGGSYFGGGASVTFPVPRDPC